ERPDLHLTETLASELCLAAKRLLSDERIWTDRTSVNFVIDQVRKLEHVDVANSDFLRERFAGHSVIQRNLARLRQSSDFEQVAYFGFACPVENRGGHIDAITEAVGQFGKLIIVER